MLSLVFHTILRLWYLKQYVFYLFLNWILNIKIHPFHSPCSLKFPIFLYIIPYQSYISNMFSLSWGSFIPTHIRSLKTGTLLLAVISKSLIGLVHQRVGSQGVVQRAHGQDIVCCPVRAWVQSVQSTRKEDSHLCSPFPLQCIWPHW